MILTIGICDDCREQVELLKKYLCHFKEQFRLIVGDSVNPEEFLARLQKDPPDLVFLDIDMGEWNGIELGEKIKTIYKQAVIIYITAYEKYALEAFRVRAFHYILKPLTGAEFDRVFQEAVASIKQSAREKPAKQSFAVRSKGELVSFAYDDIYYFEKVGHQIKIHTAERDFSYSGNFNQLLAALVPGSFAQCHQGYIVNIHKIRGYHAGTLFLADGRSLAVSRTYSAQIRETLAKLLFDAGADQ